MIPMTTIAIIAEPRKPRASGDDPPIITTAMLTAL